MEVRPVTDEDVAFWRIQDGGAEKVEMRGDHIGARNIEVVRCRRTHDPAFPECWRVPYVVAEGDITTFWFTMFCETFPPVAGVMVTTDPYFLRNPAGTGG